MVVVFGTLGYRPKSLIPTIRSTANVDKVGVLLRADRSEPTAVKSVMAAKKEVVDYCNGMHLVVDPVELEDPFDFKNIAMRIRSDIRKHKNEHKEIAIFNIAGGTRPTSARRFSCASLKGSDGLRS